MSRIVWIVITIGLLVQGALGQGTTYRLQPEDVLRIQIYNEAQVNSIVPIGKDGNISAPFIGIVRAQDKTTTELEADLVQEYIRKLRLRDPRISVTIERYRILRASVGGMVNRPGVYEIRPTDSLLTLLNNGGGPVQDGRADLRRATLRKAGSKEMIPIDLYAMLIRGDTSQNYTLEDGDELTVPEETRSRILVLGAVPRPGTYPYKEPMTLVDALSSGGGAIPYKSMLSKTIVIRERPGQPGSYVRIQANLAAFMAKGDAAQNLTLLPGDVVFIPDTKTPDPERISQLISGIANSLYILDRFGLYRR